MAGGAGDLQVNLESPVAPGEQTSSDRGTDDTGSAAGGVASSAIPYELDNSPGLPYHVTPAPSFVYAVGRIEPRFPRLSVEKEFAQVLGRTDTRELTDREALHATLTDRNNRYLARELCYVFTVQSVETYLIQPRDPGDLDLLIETIRPRPKPTDLDVVIGIRGTLAEPEQCNGLVVPIVVFDQLYSFDRDTLLDAIPQPKGSTTETFKASSGEVLDRIMGIADNVGATDCHRAMNYLAVRYPAIYTETAEQLARDASLTAVDCLVSPLTGARQIVDVIFSYTNRSTDVIEKRFVRVDVTDEFPFLVTRLSPYFDR